MTPKIVIFNHLKTSAVEGLFRFSLSNPLISLLPSQAVQTPGRLKSAYDNSLHGLHTSGNLTPGLLKLFYLYLFSLENLHDPRYRYIKKVHKSKFADSVTQYNPKILMDLSIICSGAAVGK